MDLVRDLLDAYRWRVWPRRLVVGALLLGAAVAALLPRPAPAAPRVPTADVVVARHALPAGRVLGRGDLRADARPRVATPAEAATRVRDLVGRRLAGPVTAGEVLTMLRVVGPGLAAGLPPGTVAVPLTVDAGAAGFVRVGDHVDLYRTPPGAGAATDVPATSGQAVRVAGGMLVLAVTTVTPDAPATVDTAATDQLVVACSEGQAAALVTERTNPLSPIVVADP
ncbi:MAG: Flp pilus assembly protein CpaB [Jatrophihabitans sp.]|uniref:Flp pilus assembly protein CpaB n=1 Tax=Jatrophihabitans sp. TaxID=1932789 RepID=UPI003F7CDCA8